MDYSLLQFQKIVTDALGHCFPQSYRIVAELSDYRPSSSGHTYMELIERNEQTKQIVARSRAAIWRNTAQTLQRKFRDYTGMELSNGMRVLIEAQVSFHELYGYSLVLTDIDPSYTIGEAVRLRREILRQLAEEKIDKCNRQLTLSDLPKRIAVVSSAQAAGYEDFCNQLIHSGYPFRIDLYPAIMQGGQTEESVCRALQAIQQRATHYDCVVIIRGGGATSELSAFDSYAIARAVALMPIPCIVGIGHERDTTVLDDIAHTQVKTPTACAEHLIGIINRSIHRLDQLAESSLKLLVSAIRSEQIRAERLSHSIGTAIGSTLRSEEREFVKRQTTLIQSLLLAPERERSRLNEHTEMWKKATETTIHTEQHRLQLLEQSIRLQSPDTLLARGYSMTFVNGKLITHKTEVLPQQTLTTLLVDGSIQSTVQ